MQTPTQLPVRKESGGPAPTSEIVRHPLTSLRREVDRLFEDFSAGLSNWPLSRRFLDRPLFESRFWEPKLWREAEMVVNLPAVDIQEDEKTYQIAAEMPGVDPSDLEVSISDETLTIRGEKKHARDERKKGYAMSERAYGMFERSFGLPAGVDADKISANFHQGVLNISLPKTPEAQKNKPRRIEVKTA